MFEFIYQYYIKIFSYKMTQITNQTIANIYKDLDLPMQHSIRDKSLAICQQLLLQYPECNGTLNLERKIQRAIDARKLANKNPAKLKAWETQIFLDIAPPKKVAGRKRKSLDEAGKRTRNKKLDKIIENLEIAATEEGIDKLEFFRMLKARIETHWGADDNEPKLQQHSVEDATAMMYNLDLSLNTYQELRLNLLKSGIDLPTRNAVDIYKKTLLPKSIEVEATKTSCPIKEVITQTVEAIVNVAGAATTELQQTGGVVVDSKFGLDGSGSHQIRHQSAEGDDSVEQGSNYIAAFWCPLEVKIGEDVIWTNILPNSVLYARPICLIRAKENRQSVAEHFKPIITQLKQLEDGASISLNSQDVTLSLNAEVSMIDGKMADILQGDSGAYCHYCKATSKNANDLTIILQGFPITKSFDEISKTWKALESGDISYNHPDRAGQCHEPMLERDLQFFAILHQKLRSLDHCLKILYHLVAGQKTWSEANPLVRDAVTCAKKNEVIPSIKEKCGFVVDCPTQQGGNTNSGPVADKFFSPKHRSDICSTILNSSDREAIAELLAHFNKMLSLTQNVNTLRKVDPAKVKEFGYNLMIHHRQTIPWANISQSVHQMCAHSWELFLITDGKPIARYSEQSGESWNKVYFFNHYIHNLEDPLATCVTMIPYK